MALGPLPGGSPRVARRDCPSWRWRRFDLAHQGAGPSPPPVLCGGESSREPGRRTSIALARHGEPRRRMSATEGTRADPTRQPAGPFRSGGSSSVPWGGSPGRGWALFTHSVRPSTTPGTGGKGWRSLRPFPLKSSSGKLPGERPGFGCFVGLQASRRTRKDRRCHSLEGSSLVVDSAHTSRESSRLAASPFHAGRRFRSALCATAFPSSEAGHLGRSDREPPAS